MSKKNLYNRTFILLIFFILASIGLINLYSAAHAGSYFRSQLLHSAIGFFFFFFCAWGLPLRIINIYSYPFFIFLILCLLAVLLLGYTAGGAQRWITFASFRFQPSELMKLGIILFVARFFSGQKGLTHYQLYEIWPVLFGLVLVFCLIFKQPDFGTAGICLLIACLQLFFVNIVINSKMVLYSALSFCVSVILGWNFLLRPYQKLRILNLLDPNLDPSGSGYNSIQSLIAIGSGKLFGKGFLQGTQNQLEFLPARHTDFIFSVFAEEHGFLGSLFILMLFAILIILALEIARDSKETFHALVALGITNLLFIEVTLNIAMVLGMFPVVGMPLPFFSYGGSALLTICIALGILISIDRENTRKTDEHRMEFM